MPFKSEAQRRYLYAMHPDIAKKFEKETPKGAELPAKIRPEAMKMVVKQLEGK